MWSDNEADDDFLGYQYLVGAITTIVRNESLLPTTIGVYGDWGSGKSSLIKMVERALEPDEDIVVLTFNGWLFEGYEDAKTALMGTVLEELIEHRKFLPKIEESLRQTVVASAKRLLKRVDKFKAAKGVGKLLYAVVSHDVTSVIPALSGGADMLSAGKEAIEAAKEAGLNEALKENNDQKEIDDEKSLRRDIRKFRDDFKTLLKQSKIKTLVVVIDDLDRCTPDTVIETLEAIKLFLFVPHTVFIIGADERLVGYAVRKRFRELPGEKDAVSREYLEKLVHFPVRIPPLGKNEVECYVNLLFTELSELSLEDKKKARQCVTDCDTESLFGVNFNLAKARQLFAVPAPLGESLEMAQRISPILASGLNGNPRQCKRFLNTLMMRVIMAQARKQELKQRVLAKLMLLEYFKPEFFRKLAVVQGEQDGRPSEIALLEKHLAALTQPESPQKSHTEADTSNRTSGKKKASKNAEAAGSPDLHIEVKGVEGDFQNWLSDPWTKDWLKMTPTLAGEDLRPYFFFSRDRLGLMPSIVLRMSPAAQEALTNILHASEAVRNIALKAAISLSTVDAAAVFEAIVSKVEEEEDRGAENSAFFRLFDWVGARKELGLQLITFLEQLPETSLPSNAVIKIKALFDDTEQAAAAEQLLRKWEQNNSNSSLAALARARLNTTPQTNR